MIKPYYETDIGVLYHGDCCEILAGLEQNAVHLIITSPPYDKLRSYGGHRFKYQPIARASRDTLVIGGVIVWVVGDQVINGSESGTSFLHSLYFKDCLGLNLHDTMLYEKNGAVYPPNDKSNRYGQIFEYMFVFSKGKPRTANLIKDKINRWAGQGTFGDNSERQKEGDIKVRGKFVVSEYGYRNNIWKINNGFGYSTKDKIAYEHPAIFPEVLAQDHILSWSNLGDMVADPMAGSGTVLKMAEKLNRRWIGIEIEEKYCEIAAKRIENERKQLKLF